MLRKIQLLVVLIAFSSGFSQGVGIGKWKSYFPFRDVIDIVKHGNNVYGATQNGIIIQNYADGSIEKLTKINGLSDNGLTSIDFNVANNALVIGYSNGNADLVIGNETTNLFQIKESSITGDKGIYDVYCKGDYAYLSCGFGIVVFDVSKKEIKDTYIIGPGSTQIKINRVFIHNGIIYAGADNGIYTASESSIFLSDFSSWSKSTTIPNSTNPITAIDAFNGDLIVNSVNSGSSDSLFIFDGSSWGRITSIPADKNSSISSFENTLIVSQYDSVYVLDTSFVTTQLLKNYNSFWKAKANSVIYDGDYFYLGDEENAIVRMRTNFNADFSQPNGIYSNSVLDIEVEDGHLWGSTGSLRGSGWNKTFNNDGAFHYDIKENNWTIYNGAFQAGQYCFPNGCVNDIVGIAVNPDRPTVGYACSFSNKPVIQLFNNKVGTAYDSSNSSIKISSSHGDRFAVADAAFDEDGNLWAVSSWNVNSLHVKTPSGIWKSFDCGAGNQHGITSRIIVDELNFYKWVVFKDKNLVVYDDKETPLNEIDDEYQVIGSGAANGKLESIPICVTEDLDNEIWIGTEEGIYVIYTPSEIFSSGNFEAQRIKIEQDGNIEFLLENEIITAIEIDGGNRKWIGTQASGVFVLSPDGITQIHHFNETNSPLLSNTIFDIAIDDESGEVFFSTDQGLISYRGEATEGQTVFNEVYAYPNPVTPDYSGKIAIKGLVRDSDVRITDLTGNVVFATKSIGGQAIWDGNKLDGQKVSSGVYLVFMIAPEGVAKEVTKILVVK